MRKRIMILDAYNILHRLPKWKPMLERSLESGREALLSYCRRWMMQRGDVWLFYVVFDGDSSVSASHSSSGPGVRVVYSATGQAADDRILDIVREFGEGFDYIVVSDDRYVMTRAKLLGAEIMASSAFAGVLGGEDIGVSKVGRGASRACDKDDGDALPVDAAKNITDHLRRLWGG